MKVVFDTNVFIAAALKGSFAEDVLKMSSTNLVILVCSEEILEELHQKLDKKFQWSREDITLFTKTIREIVQIVKVREKVNIVRRDPKDNMILESALAGKADLIVSIDQDLIKLKNFKGMGIIHPKSLPWIFPEYFKKS